MAEKSAHYRMPPPTSRMCQRMRHNCSHSKYWIRLRIPSAFKTKGQSLSVFRPFAICQTWHEIVQARLRVIEATLRTLHWRLDARCRTGSNVVPERLLGRFQSTPALWRIPIILVALAKIINLIIAVFMQALLALQ